MNTMFFFPLAGLLTLMCAFLEWRRIWHKPIVSDCSLNYLLSASILMTLIGILTKEGIHSSLSIDIAISAALSTVLVQSIHLWGRVKHGIGGLSLLLLPATGLPLLLIPFLPHQHISIIQVDSFFQGSHFALSILGYALLTLAAIHASIQLYLNHSLKHKHIGALFRALPSLAEIETHMYAQVHAACWILGFSIATGLSWQWMDNGLTHLFSHKILLGVFAWLVLMVLLLSHREQAWSARRSSVMVLFAYTLLLLSYFGVRLIQSWS